MQLSRITCLALLVVGISACDHLQWGERANVPVEFYEAFLQLSVPFATDGTARVYEYDGDQSLVVEGRLQDGYVELALGNRGLGDLVVEVSDVTLQELRTDALVAGGQTRWRVPLFDVRSRSVQKLVMTPWNHIAWVGSGENTTRYASSWAAPMEQLLSCGTGLSGLLTMMPFDPDSGEPGEGLSPATWAYLLWGGWSDLAVWLSVIAELPANARIHSQSLMDGVALDASGGPIDGIGPEGLPVELAAGLPLPGDLLRQPFAQAIRRFADSQANATGIDSSALTDALRCISSSTGQSLGNQSGPFDTDGADVASAVPVDGTTINGLQDYRCDAEDALSDIVEMHVSAMRAGGQLEPMVTEFNVTLNGQNATCDAVLDTTSVPDGDVTMRCTAVDAWGNEGVFESLVGVNNSAGSASVLEPAPDSQIRGDEVFIRCACDDEYLEDCYLSQPPADSRSVVDIDDDRYLLDTMGYLDGPMAIECSAKSTGLEPISGSVQVEIDNLDPTTWTGHVAMDSPVVGLTVDAQLALDDGTLGPVFATSTTDGMGRFELAMPDTISGWVLVSAHGIDAFFRNGAVPMEGADDTQRGAIVRFRSSDRLWLLEHYSPTRPAEPLDGLSVNLYSTAVAKLALVIQAAGEGDLTYATYQANHMIGRILDRQDGMNVGRTLVRDFVTDSVLSGLTDRSSTRLGLGHVGLSRRGAEIAIEAGDDPNSLNSLYMLPYILRDLENAILEGRDGQDAVISVTPLYDINHLTMRWELATAIARWLDNALLGDIAVEMNTTQLTADGFSGTDGFLRLMAENDSPLFGSEPYRPFDQWGPDIAQLELVDESGTRINVDAVRVRGNVTLVIRALDPSGFSETPVSITMYPGPVGEMLPVSLFVTSMTLEARYPIDSTILRDGLQTVTVTVLDSLGNPSERLFHFRCDNTEPTVIATGPSVTQTTSIVVDWEAYDDAGIIRRVEVSVGERVVPIENPQRSGSTAIELERCNETYTVTVSALDEGEWWGSDSFQVRCDDLPSELTMEPSESLVIASAEYGADGEIVYGHELESLRDLGWPGTNIVLNVYVNELDLGSGSVREIEFGAPGAVSAVYRYSIDEKHIHEDVITPNENGIYRLPIAYQTLLPSDATPETNDMAKAAHDAQHLIVIDVIDDAENIKSYDFPFGLNRKMPSVAIDGCRYSTYLTDLSLTPPTFHEAFTGFGDVQIFEAEVIWDTDIAANSLTPRNELEAYVGIEYSVLELLHGRRRRPEGPIWEQTDEPDPCHDFFLNHAIDGQDVCYDGIKVVDTESLSSLWIGGGIYKQSTHLRFVRSGNNAEIASLPPNTRWSIIANEEAPRFGNYSTGETDWSWPIDLGEYRSDTVQTGVDLAIVITENWEMTYYKSDWEVMRTPTMIKFAGSLDDVTFTHPLGIEVGVQLLGDCRDAITHIWETSPP